MFELISVKTSAHIKCLEKRNFGHETMQGPVIISNVYSTANPTVRRIKPCLKKTTTFIYVLKVFV